MTIEAEVHPHAEDVLTPHNAQIIEYLRSCNPARRARSVDVRLADAVEVERGHIRPVGIRFALREEEAETTEAGGELVDYARRDHASPADRKVGRATKDFTKRRIVRIDLRPAV